MPRKKSEIGQEIIAAAEVRVIDEVEETKIRKTWEDKQREVLLNVVDYNLETLASLIRKGQIDLKPKYQRRFRWDEPRKSKLIESFLMNVPVPPIFLNEDAYGKYSVIDGKQRLTAVSDFINDRFAIVGLGIFEELNGKKFSDLDPDMQSMLSTRPTLRATIILRQSDPDIKFQVFERLNTGGIRLNAQEIRNSTFTGSFNDLILEMSESVSFHRLLRIKNKSNSSIYKEMKDAELVLRYFAFRDSWEKFSGGISTTLSKFMDNNKHLPSDKIAEHKKNFEDAISKVDITFGGVAFQRWNPKTDKWRSPVLAALFDAQMIAVTDFSFSELRENKERIQEGMKNLFLDEEFQKKIDAAVPRYFVERIRDVRKMIKEAIS